FGAIGREEGYSFKGEESSRKFVNKVKKELTKAKNSPTILHGVHTQAMFECLVASLDNCVVLKQEDSGEIYARATPLEVPDLRLLLDDGEEFFVEVKNYYQSNPMASFSFERRYFNGLRQYARFFNHDLKIAIYWAKGNIWTLVSEANIKDDGVTYSISMCEAIKANEMSVLGDCMVGTKIPLRMKIFVDRNKPHFISDYGEAHFTISNVELYCGDTRIDDSFEKKLAYYLMLFGKWPFNDPTCESIDNKPIAIEFRFQPPETTSGQGFEIVGTLSTMFSRYYGMITAPDGDVERISPKQEPSSMGIIIPKDYTGKYLPLWRFVVEPENED
ncbi:MAG: hypothetical protein HWN65_24405, partial [Candidatus Helarchaeota archaeon]|nr:hypothetical protein [Candidatus Helarchaeota archaeon]